MRGNGNGSPPPDVVEELAGELKHLRELVREVGENFILRREGEIEAIISQVASIPPCRLKKDAHRWLQEIREVKLKPAKGRIRDIRGLGAIIDALTEQVLSTQEKTKR